MSPDEWSVTSTTWLISGMASVIATSAAGSVRYEIIDEHGYPLPGLSLEQTRPIYGDDVERKIEVQPAKRSERSALAARPLRVRFQLRDADLFSIKFED